MVFRVQQQAETWLARLGSDTGGEYLGGAQALKIASFAARDARRRGYWPRLPMCRAAVSCDWVQSRTKLENDQTSHRRKSGEK